jgi:hypothetical protein
VARTTSPTGTSPAAWPRPTNHRSTPPHGELREELGLSVEIGALLSVDWVPPHGPWDDTIVFVFDGGTLSAARIETLKITDNELSGSASATAMMRPNCCGPGCGNAPRMR